MDCRDIFLVNGTNWPGQAHEHSTLKLYHNHHDRLANMAGSETVMVTEGKGATGSPAYSKK